MDALFITDESATIADVVAGATPKKHKLLANIFTIMAVYADDLEVNIVFTNQHIIKRKYGNATVVSYVIGDIENQLEECFKRYTKHEIFLEDDEDDDDDLDIYPLPISSKDKLM